MTFVLRALTALRDTLLYPLVTAAATGLRDTALPDTPLPLPAAQQSVSAIQLLRWGWVGMHCHRHA
jgi:hypothetical protein